MLCSSAFPLQQQHIAADVGLLARSDVLCRLVTAAKTLQGLLQAIVLGDEAEGLSTTLLHSAYARHLLLDPVCLRHDPTKCYTSSDAFYVVSVLTGSFKLLSPRWCYGSLTCDVIAAYKSRIASYCQQLRISCTWTGIQSYIWSHHQQHLPARIGFDWAGRLI